MFSIGNHIFFDTCFVAFLLFAPQLFVKAESTQEVDIIAHRGASHEAPENTLAAFQLAFKQGADGVEGDFWLTKDGHIVCVHDETMKKTAGVDMKVAETTLADLKKLDVGSWKNRKHANERIPTLPEVLAVIPEDKIFLIEVKCGPEILPRLKKDLDASSLNKDQVVVIAFDSNVVAASRKSMPEIKSFWLTSWEEKVSSIEPSKQLVVRTLKNTNASGLGAKALPEVLNREFAQELANSGFELHCWTVNDPKLAKQMIKAGVQSITTDRPAWLRKRLAK